MATSKMLQNECLDAQVPSISKSSPGDFQNASKTILRGPSVRHRKTSPWRSSKCFKIDPWTPKCPSSQNIGLESSKMLKNRFSETAVRHQAPSHPAHFFIKKFMRPAIHSLFLSSNSSAQPSSPLFFSSNSSAQPSILLFFSSNSSAQPSSLLFFSSNSSAQPSSLLFSQVIQAPSHPVCYFSREIQAPSHPIYYFLE